MVQRLSLIFFWCNYIVHCGICTPISTFINFKSTVFGFLFQNAGHDLFNIKRKKKLKDIDRAMSSIYIF